MYRDPVLWNEGQQLLGEEIKVYMNDSTIDWAHIINQALTVEMERLGSLQPNFRKGDQSLFRKWRDAQGRCHSQCVGCFLSCR